MGFGMSLGVGSRGRQMPQVRLWEQSECVRTEYLEEACKEPEVNLSVLG